MTPLNHSLAINYIPPPPRRRLWRTSAVVVALALAGTALSALSTLAIAWGWVS